MTPVLEGIAKELRHHGLKVKKVPGWKERGRPYTFEPRAFFDHHTASNRNSGDAPALGIVTNGRIDLPGPLANFLIGRSGTVYLVAGGYCNHAGLGGPLKGIPENSGNRYALGCEIENDGIGEPYPEVQLNAVDIVNAVCLHRMKRGQYFAIGHKEWTPRKIDPSFLMDALRRRVKALLKKLWPRKRK